MARVTDALLNGKGFGQGMTQPMLDLQRGGQMGWAPNLTEWINNQAYIQRNLVCIVLEAPRFMQYMPDSQVWVQTLKSMMELHARSIEGFNAALEVETEEHPVGGGGEMQEEFTDVKRGRSQPAFTFIEKYGMPISTFLYNWITYGMMDADAKYAMVGTLNGNRPTDMLADQYSMSCLFFEPDPTHRKVVKSWITTNMFPKGTGEITGKRDLTSPGELTTLSVEFTGISQFNLGANVFAQQILDTINITNANPYLRPSFISGISPDVQAATTGYKTEAENLGAAAISR